MSTASNLPGVLIVCDPEEVAAFGEPLRQPMSTGPVRVWTASHFDDAIDLYAAHRPEVLVVAAQLRDADTGQLIESVRGLVGRAEVAVVVVGNLAGPLSTALDAAELGGDRFVSRPLSGKALRYAVSVSIDAARLARGGRVSAGEVVREVPEEITSGYRQAQRDRWARLADSIVDGIRADDHPEPAREADAAPLPPPLVIQPRRHSALISAVSPARSIDRAGGETPWPEAAPERKSGDFRTTERISVKDLLAANEAAVPESDEDRSHRISDRFRTTKQLNLAEMRDEGLAKPEGRGFRTAEGIRVQPLRSPALDPAVGPAGGAAASATGATADPALDSAVSLAVGSAAGPASDGAAAPVTGSPAGSAAAPASGSSTSRATKRISIEGLSGEPPLRRERTTERISVPELLADAVASEDAPPPLRISNRFRTAQQIDLTEMRDEGLAALEPSSRSERVTERLSAVELSDLSPEDDPAIGESPWLEAERAKARNAERPAPTQLASSRSLSALSSLSSLSSLPAGRDDAAASRPSSTPEAVWSAPELLAQLNEATAEVTPAVPPPVSPPGGREFARQLRQKMSAMAQRLFAHQGGSSAPGALDAAPRHDHQIEFDLAALVEEPALSNTPEIIGLRTSITPMLRETQPGSWESASKDPRDRIPDTGELVRGVCDAPAIVVRMWTMGATGRVAFFRGEIEKIVFFDQGRPAFASSTELHDRMGELLYREGKITHAQYMHSKSLVAESGRRMGEVLVELGYLKRRELYPAVRRHVEDIVYSLFAWDHGTYRITLEERATTERIRLARHPEALVLEGIRRKLDRYVLERLVGPPSTVLELHDRERLAGLAAAIELSSEERAALAAIDGQADLPMIARAAGLSVAAVLPLAWALIVLGYVSARRDGSEVPEETSQVGESDLAIDRERVRARWQLVAEADYFALLGVRRDATSFEIRRAYESARRDFAAEGFPGELRHELARELDDIATVLDEAFRVLRDDPLRREYLAHLLD